MNKRDLYGLERSETLIAWALLFAAGAAVELVFSYLLSMSICASALVGATAGAVSPIIRPAMRGIVEAVLIHSLAFLVSFIVTPHSRSHFRVLATCSDGVGVNTALSFLLIGDPIALLLHVGQPRFLVTGLHWHDVSRAFGDTNQFLSWLLPCSMSFSKHLLASDSFGQC